MPADGATLNEMTAKAYGELKRDTPMTIYVVTNTGNPTWASGVGFDTLDKVKKQKLPAPYPIRVLADANRTDDLLIPMSGQVDDVTVTDKTLIVVPVTRMYAKIKVRVDFKVADMTIYDVNIAGIPWYCRVSTLSEAPDENGEPQAVPFPEGTEMLSRAFRSEDAVPDDNGDAWLILYMPENIRGEIADADKATSQNIPENALNVHIRAKYDGMDYNFIVYPGENSKNNFNVRRNCVYRVSVDVSTSRDQHNPSSNCFIVKPHGKLSFEPYNRVEKGGGYSIGDYLNPDEDSKRIDKVEIVWQTKDCIGDNTNGDLVKFTLDEADPVNSKITVFTGEEGNALIAARNPSGKIVWSWHIWVTSNEPDNYANAYVFTTYRWDSGRIYHDAPRVPGYGVMPCNLGALAFRSDDDMTEKRIVGVFNPDYIDVPVYSLKQGTRFPDSQIRTFGMMYQWGRKDPFPPMTHSTGTEDANGTLDYENKYTDTHYANDNETEVSKTDKTSDSYLFHSTGSEKDVPFSIQNPTVYIIGSTMTSNSGNWCSPNDNKLWGGLDPSNSGLTKLNVGNDIYIYDNYGEKSIFDPCPKGWRVPPGDLWMSFTSTGKNPESFDYVNQCSDENGHRPGLSMYMQRWQGGPTLYFPCQGSRAENGRFKNTGLCGNYNTATCVSNTRVNILHLHRDMAVVSKYNKSLLLFKVFETLSDYISKSVASPVRCVRDSR